MGYPHEAAQASRADAQPADVSAVDVRQTAVLQLSAYFDGQLHEYATDAAARAAVDRFGRAARVVKAVEASGAAAWYVGCGSSRGQDGWARLLDAAAGLWPVVHGACRA
jgi:hypothetical protein